MAQNDVPQFHLFFGHKSCVMSLNLTRHIFSKSCSFLSFQLFLHHATFFSPSQNKTSKFILHKPTVWMKKPGDDSSLLVCRALIFTSLYLILFSSFSFLPHILLLFLSTHLPFLTSHPLLLSAMQMCFLWFCRQRLISTLLGLLFIPPVEREEKRERQGRKVRVWVSVVRRHERHAELDEGQEGKNKIIVKHKGKSSKWLMEGLWSLKEVVLKVENLIVGVQVELSAGFWGYYTHSVRTGFSNTNTEGAKIKTKSQSNSTFIFFLLWNIKEALFNIEKLLKTGRHRGAAVSTVGMEGMKGNIGRLIYKEERKTGRQRWGKES